MSRGGIVCLLTFLTVGCGPPVPVSPRVLRVEVDVSPNPAVVSRDSTVTITVTVRNPRWRSVVADLGTPFVWSGRLDERKGSEHGYTLHALAPDRKPAWTVVNRIPDYDQPLHRFGARGRERGRFVVHLGTQSDTGAYAAWPPRRRIGPGRYVISGSFNVVAAERPETLVVQP